MGGNTSKEILELDRNVRFNISHRNKSEVNISLKKPLDIRLTPHFTTADRPGHSILYRLKLRFCDERKPGTAEGRSESCSSSSEESQTDRHKFSAALEFHQIMKREGKKYTIGIERKTSLVKDNCWVGNTSDITIEDNRLRLTGILKESSKTEGKEPNSLEFDLILCPSELMVPGFATDWSLVGSFYVNNLTEKKSYKWRAAVPQITNEEQQ